MAQVVIMPRQGQSVESCVITEWKKKVGDKVEEKDVLFSFPLEEEQVRSCFPKQGDDGTFPQRRKRVRCFASTPKVPPTDRTAILGGKAGSPALRLCLFPAD